MATVVELIVVCVPSTCRLPAITTVPVLSPTAAGSIVNEAGPARYPVSVALVSVVLVFGCIAVSAVAPCVAVA